MPLSLRSVTFLGGELKQTATDEALTEIADALFVEHDKTEAADAEAKPR